MLVILEGADFSDNNVGEITIPRDALNTTTELILSKMTKTVTDSQKYALDDLIIGLKDSGIWDKIVHMFVPFFANSVAEALYNAKLDIPVTGITNYANFLSSGYLLDENGLRYQPWVSGTTLGVSSLQNTGHSLLSNSSFIASVIRKPTTGTTYYIGSLGGAIIVQYTASSGTLGLRLVSGTNAIVRSLTKTFDNWASLVCSVKYPGDAVTDLTVISDGTLGTTVGSAGTYTNPDTESDLIRVAGNGFSEYQRNESASIAIQIFGSNLTDTEAATLDELLSSFHGKI